MVKVVNLVASGHFDREFDTAELAEVPSLPVTKRTQDTRVYFDFEDVPATVSLSRKASIWFRGLLIWGQ